MDRLLAETPVLAFDSHIDGGFFEYTEFFCIGYIGNGLGVRLDRRHVRKDIDQYLGGAANHSVPALS